MDPYPFVGLNNFTVPVAISTSSLECGRYGPRLCATRIALDLLIADAFTRGNHQAHVVPMIVAALIGQGALRWLSATARCILEGMGFDHTDFSVVVKKRASPPKAMEMGDLSSRSE
jgi:hypothetical protein